ncbi:hypothetical protein [Amycolatopsis mediterranei]|uniref:Secreted protein n=1 Tax=Amycolatopsis mediterranei (strain S699) TaxID=713604 RepID=A0A9R0P6A9_AMYMS|nr:hypothetical protein [Amycolatopsis mediterranei]AEK47030.1 hypothetical protein RAM_42815 [Amycolatopsis mediterranei S699]UZF75029.1 hypothetical protein ISP_008596 [Amycolatopsis mediterranei]
MVKKLAGIAGPALAICALAALPLIGATTAYANAGVSAAVVTPTPTPDGNPWHG